MKLTIIMFIFAIFFGVAYSQVCGSFTNCDACVQSTECGWCAATQLCLNGTVAGPTGSQCVGPSWEYARCTPCASFADCRTCLAHDSDCFWCASSNEGQGACKDIGFVGCSYTRTCPCEIYANCATCIDDASCQWCGETETCAPVNQTCASSFNFTTGCSCQFNRDCPTCRNSPGCKWCLSGNCDVTCGGGFANSCPNFCALANGDCEACTGLPGCAYCPNENTCVDATTATCAFTRTCPQCQFAAYCDACISSPYCVWCEDTASCQPKHTNCLIAYGCEQFCNQINSCEGCNQVKGCGWCESTGKCSDTRTATCLFAHTCSPQQCGFNGGSFVGGMALMLGIILMGAVGYAFYRWRTGHRVSYSAMK